jgi:hypothetical protein
MDILREHLGKPENKAGRFNMFQYLPDSAGKVIPWMTPRPWRRNWYQVHTERFSCGIPFMAADRQPVPSPGKAADKVTGKPFSAAPRNYQTLDNKNNMH